MGRRSCAISFVLWMHADVFAASCWSCFSSKLPRPSPTTDNGDIDTALADPRLVADPRLGESDRSVPDLVTRARQFSRNSGNGTQVEDRPSLSPLPVNRLGVALIVAEGILRQRRIQRTVEEAANEQQEDGMLLGALRMVTTTLFDRDPGDLVRDAVYGNPKERWAHFVQNACDAYERLDTPQGRHKARQIHSLPIPTDFMAISPAELEVMRNSELVIVIPFLETRGIVVREGISDVSELIAELQAIQIRESGILQLS